MNFKEQGINAENIFHGDSNSLAVRLMYKDSAGLFSKIIHSELEIGEYTLADLGSGKGEFLKDVITLLSKYTFKTIAVDVNIEDLKSNNADEKKASNLSKLDIIDDKSVDIVIMRYALSWNEFDKQKDIIKEIKRITKRVAIVQHQGAPSKNPEKLQIASKQLFSGVIPQLKRDEFFFSEAKDIERFMDELDINYEKIQDKNIENLSDIFIEKYQLLEEDAKKVREILDNADNLTISTWILRF